MKLLNLNFLKSKNSIYLFVLTLLFSVFILLNKELLFKKFNPQVVGNYQRSQDIEDSDNKIKDRIFISDEDIYIASGYLYINGSSPLNYNFQHPPFIKYLFGLSAKYFNLPLLPNIIFAGLLIFEVYLLGKLAFKSELIGLLSSIMLMFDLVFKEVTAYALLDLGQIVFILGFIISSLFFKKYRLTQGVLLGLAIASKFYSPVFVFLVLIYIYKLINNKFDIKHELAVLLLASLVFSICYIKAFPFNIFHHQAKVIKFMLDHNQAVEWGGVLKIFFRGYYLWPVLFFVNLYQLFRSKVSEVNFILSLLPVTYFILLLFQIPFTRYFILLLPFLYLSFGSFLVNLYQDIFPIAQGDN